MHNNHHPAIAQGRILVVPGVYDVLSARIAQQAGFHSAVLTGYGVAASALSGTAIPAAASKGFAACSSKFIALLPVFGPMGAEQRFLARLVFRNLRHQVGDVDEVPPV